MAHASRSAAPLDLVEKTLDGIFIEIGKSLRISDKVAPKTLAANANAKLRAAIPRDIETFHQALDDIEADIILAKAVLLRDLEEARAKRIASENPPEEVIEGSIKLEPAADVALPEEIIMADVDLQAPSSAVKEEGNNPALLEASVLVDPPKEVVARDPNVSKDVQGLSPPSSNELNPKPAVVDEKTSSAPDTQVTTGIADTSVDSLLEISADSDNHDDLALNFDDMDFPLADSIAGENTQSHSHDFDLATFGDNLQDFNMTDLQASHNIGEANNNAENKAVDLFDIVNNTAGAAELMDVDMDFNLRPAEESSFDELFLQTGEVEDVPGGDDMVHDVYDKAFFGL